MTSKVTYEMAVLIQRAADGDALVLKDLWPLMFDTPFDPTRPLEDIAADVAKKITAWNEANKPEEPAQPAPADDLFVEGVALLLKAITAPRSPKK